MAFNAIISFSDLPLRFVDPVHCAHTPRAFRDLVYGGSRRTVDQVQMRPSIFLQRSEVLHFENFRETLLFGKYDEAQQRIDDLRCVR